MKKTTGKEIRTLQGQLPPLEEEKSLSRHDDARLQALFTQSEESLSSPRHGGRIVLDREALDMLSIYKESFPKKMSYSEVICFLLKRTNHMPPVYFMLFRLLSRLANGLYAGADEAGRKKIQAIAVPVIEYIYDLLQKEGHFPDVVAKNERERKAIHEEKGV